MDRVLLSLWSGSEIFLPCSALVQQSDSVWIGRICQQGRNHETSLWHGLLSSVSTFNTLFIYFLMYILIFLLLGHDLLSKVNFL